MEMYMIIEIADRHKIDESDPNWSKKDCKRHNVIVSVSVGLKIHKNKPKDWIVSEICR